uniref:RING-type E3 ubiquitin transferase n=2 Tax=Lygus hesperus TaxID=30085 RepID=A0A146MBF6_LYGHE
MEDWILDDLLECSVCLERLDTSSKVLPCQHTFCKKCLEEISRTHNELRCPECRILVETNIDDLPPNVLLMRILEGIRNVAPDHSSNKPQSQSTHSTDQHPSRNPRSPQIEKPSSKIHHQPCAKAIYDYFSNEPGDLSFKKGEIINLRKKVDLNWFRGDINGRVGVFPANYVQVIEPLPSQVPQCKALYDFKMANDEEEGCLAFNKGEVITVIRRVDENWAEGKLNNRIGIFPIAFVELNSVARALMKLSIEAQPGPSRVVPPTPTSKEESFAIPSVTHQLAGSTQAPNAFPPIVTSSLPTSDSSSTSLTSPSSTSNSTTPTTSSTSSHTSPSSPSHATPVSPTFGPVKRHSFGSTLPNGTKTSTKRHSAEILSNQDSSNEPRSLPVDVTLAQNHLTPTHLERTGSQRLKRNSEAVPPIPGPQVQHSSLLLPALYVALYPYKPGNSDELELKRGAIYTVTERCQDGWFKGQHFRSQKAGVFPGNYVAPAKSLPALQAQVRGLCRTKPTGNVCTPRNGTPPLEPRNPTTYMKSPQPIPSHKESRTTAPVVVPHAMLPTDHLSTSVIPPPNVSVPSASSKNLEKAKEKKDKGGGLMRRLTSMKKSKSPPPTPYSMDNPVFEDSSINIAPPVHVRSGSCPNQLISSSSTENRLFSPTSSHRSKIKERPSISRISPRMLSDSRNIQHRKSSSMDGPSSDADTSHMLSSRPLFLDDHKGPSCATTPFSNVIDIAKLSQSKVVLAHEMTGEGSGMRPDTAHRGQPHDDLFSQVSSRLQTRSNNEPVKPSKRSMQSSDQVHNQDSKPQSKGLPLPRERFRCIVPYPPNSDYELELQLGDVIYVHKKRDDGWYKGTQQRTGRTGLFPASFVQSF